MDTTYAEEYYELEDRNWWLLSHADFITRLVELDKRSSLRLLDIGCGGGLFLGQQPRNEKQDLFRIDLSLVAAQHGKKRDLQNIIVADAKKLPYGDGSFDVIVASDILEHMEEEASVLADWHRALHADGQIFVFVPAFRFLWSQHDEFNEHFRRYTRGELVTLLEKNGFAVTRSSYWNILLFLPILLVRAFQIAFRIKQKSHFPHPPSLINNLFLLMFRFENRFLSHFNAPFGVSAYVVATKR